MGTDPLIIHVKRLNVIVRYLQKNPKKLTYRPFSTHDTHLRIVSDAAFKKEEEKGHSLRGTLYLRAPGDSKEHFYVDSTVHVLEYCSKALRHVTRSTFAAELHGACDSADMGILIGLMLHEMKCGPVNAKQARAMRDAGGYQVPMVLQIDA